MTKISKKTDYDTWYMRNYARGISTFVISIWVLLAISYSISTPSYQAPSFTNEVIVVRVFLLVTLVSVIIAWWREGIGGLLLTIAGLAAIIVVMLTLPLREYWVILFTGAPFLISGILYLKCWRRIKKMNATRYGA